MDEASESVAEGGQPPSPTHDRSGGLVTVGQENEVDEAMEHWGAVLGKLRASQATIAALRKQNAAGREELGAERLFVK